MKKIERFYREQWKFLLQSGALYWLPWLTEERYLLLRMAAMLLCALCAAGFDRLFGIQGVLAVGLLVAAAGFGAFLPRLVFQISNVRDNEQMVSDIRKLYEYVKIQVKAGMYLTNTLSACYLAISNRRLKQGLLELNSRLIATNSVAIAIEDFSEKFSNEYIDYFCLIVSQSEQSGRMAQMLDDMSRQMEDLERYMMRQKRGRMERKVLFLTLLVFIGILLIAAYQLAVSLLSSVNGIMN